VNLPLSYLEISREALQANILSVRKSVGEHQQVIAVVKANAYGHGLAQVVPAIEDLVEAFQVDDIEELRSLRELTQKRALILGYMQPSDLEEATALGAEIAIYDSERLPLLATLEKPVKLHLKIDALLGRQGLLPEALPSFLLELQKYPALTLAGVYSHFSNLEDTPSHEQAHAQLQTYEAALQVVRVHGFSDFDTHISATSGIMAFEGNESSRSLVRLGIGLYGLEPSAELAAAYPSITFTPALRWVSHLAQVKDIPQGFPVGYGVTYVAPRAMRMGIVPQGYSDGFSRNFSNLGKVLIDGQLCPVIGRVAMNMVAVDLTTSPNAKAGSEVVLLGTQGDKTLTATMLAEQLGTINYEVVARLNPLLPRILT
jgi:alanine racemase